MKVSFKIVILVVLVSLSSLTLTGCATLTTGTTQNVTVVTEKEVDGANCKLVDKKVALGTCQAHQVGLWSEKVMDRRQ